MFDITEYLNSRDVADYWKKIGFNERCTPQQAAFVIWNSYKSFDKKIAAWERLCGESDDCPLASERQCKNMGLPAHLTGSLHNFLRAYISLCEQLKEQFYAAGDSAVYTFRTYYFGDSDWYEDRKIFASAEECFKNAFDTGVAIIRIKKHWISSERAIEITTNGDGTIMFIDADGLPEEQLNIFQAFEWMWFNFPTPFKRGDIVESNYTPLGLDLCELHPFVLTNLCTWGSEEYRQNGIPDEDGEYERADKRLKRLAEGGDLSDMTAHGYFLSGDGSLSDGDGSVYFECMHRYLDLEYYEVIPHTHYCTLTAFSNYVKGKIDGELLAKAYHAILQLVQANRQMRELFPSFTKEGLILAGLAVEEPELSKRKRDEGEE